MEEEKEEKKKIICVTSNMAEPMWSRFAEMQKEGSINYTFLENFEKLHEELDEEGVEVKSFIDNKALLNEIRKKTSLDLQLNSGVRVEVKRNDRYIIYCVSASNLNDLYKYADKEELPSGVNLQIIRYEFY